MSGKAIGIDLGTTYSVVAHIDESGTPQIITNASGQATTASAIWLRGDGDHLVGREALAQAPLSPDDIVLGIKRRMGDEGFTFGGRTPAELSAMILEKLKRDAESALGESVTKAVITVPAYFEDAPRKATRRAGELAGLDVLALPNEPTAAALFFGLQKLDEGSTTLVYDLGGGTFDASILRRADDLFEVVASDGSRRLGGEDWTAVLHNHVCEQYESFYGVSPLENPVVYGLLREKAELAKCELATARHALITLAHDGATEVLQVSQDQFDTLTESLVAQTIEMVDRALEKARLRRSDVDVVLLVGGSSRLRGVLREVEAAFGMAPQRFDSPDLIVAKGAALYTQAKMNEASGRLTIRSRTGLVVAELQETTAHGVGIVVVDSVEGKTGLYTSMMIPPGNRVPAKATSTYALPERGPDYFNVPVVQCQADRESPFGCPLNKTYRFSGWPSGKRPRSIRVVYRYSKDAEVDLAAFDADAGTELDKDVIPFEYPESPDVAQGTANVVLCIDTSGSMDGEPIEHAKREVVTLLRQIGADRQDMRVGLVAFGGRAHLLSPLSDDLDAISGATRRLTAYGGTPMREALDMARDQLAGLSTGTRNVLLVSDGFPNEKDATSRAALQLKQDGIALMVIAIGEQGRGYLETLGDEYRKIETVTELSEAMYAFLSNV